MGKYTGQAKWAKKVFKRQASGLYDSTELLSNTDDADY